MQIANSIILLFLISLSFSLLYSALRLGQNSMDNEIEIVSIPDEGYYIVFMSQFSLKDSDYTFCFRERPVVNRNEKECDLGNKEGNFNCLTYNPYQKTYSKWVINSNFQKVQDQVQIQINKAVFDEAKYSGSIGISSKNIDDTTNYYSFVSKDNTFYEVVSVPTAQTFTVSPMDIKYNFMSTFYSQDPYTLVKSGNLLVQKQAVCFREDNIYHVLFLGYVLRDNNDLYMIGMVSYDANKQSFAMWSGLSYSKDHANRDMVGIDYASGLVTDLFSLYASAPFDDQAKQIKGVENYFQLASSTQSVEMISWFYFIHFYRDMTSGDLNGDEIIRFKINNQYCFVSSVDYSITDFADYPSQPFLLKSSMHRYLNCFTPDLSLGDQQLQIRLLIISFFIMIVFILL